MKSTVAVNVRFPTDLHEELKRRADEEERSLNGEVIWLVRLALDSLKKRERRTMGEGDG